ncbi:MAG: hypothetical protein Q9163_000795 [Psora crenata]
MANGVILGLPAPPVLAGWDWICQNLTRSNAAAIGSSKLPPKIGVCGEAIGGSLAAMLALTECHRVGKDSRGIFKHRINAAVVGNPLLDWTALFPEGHDTMSLDRPARRESVSKPQGITRDDDDSNHMNELVDLGLRKPHGRGPENGRILSIESLLESRKMFFHRPEQFFDPFASPLLFFRTPTFELPSGQLPILGGHTSSRKDDGPVVERKKRFYRRQYPPLYASLLLPPMKITFGEDSVLKDQALDFVDRLRASGRWEEGLDPPISTNDVMPRYIAEQKEGLGLWGEKDVMDIGAWFGEVLRRPHFV